MMATVYRCDRCGKEDKEAHFQITIPLVSRYSRHGYLSRTEYDRKNYDVCESCMIELNEFLQPKKVAAPGTFIEVK